MPIYEYQCLQCGKRTELLQRMDEAPLATCPQCGGEVRKLISAPAVQFKGSGWYVTDYAGKKGGAAKSEGKTDGKSEGKSESSASDSGSSSEKSSSSDKAVSSGSSGSAD